MRYRRFGKTELQMPVITAGAMRFQKSWNADEIDTIEDADQKKVNECLVNAFENGITHIETARGYGTSEYQVGIALQELPRKEILLQTKIGPTDSAEEFLSQFEESLERLQTDYVDLLSIHGINNADLLKKTVKNGALDACEQLKEQGKVKHIGFSSHGSAETIIQAIETDRFEYVNLHWFYVDQSKFAAMEVAQGHDMGVFIISPNDKGGKLYDPPEKLVDLCHPLSPMIFNDLYCLLQPEIHTLSIGAAQADDFDSHVTAARMLNDSDTPDLVKEVFDRLEDEAVATLGEDWWYNWPVGLPKWEDVPGEINIHEILRLWNLAKAFDMIEYGKMRYNLLGNGDHWFPGQQAGELDKHDLAGCLAESPFAEHVPQILAEAHDMFKGEEVKRLQEDE
jgi:hypothetical protein